MRPIPASSEAHPKGEPEIAENTNISPPWPIDTPGGRVHAEWADDAPVTREGSLAFFCQFLHLGGRWDELTREIPLTYASNNASKPKDIIGALVLGILAGHWRYAHLSAIRGDGVNPGLLGMEHTPSEDAVRRGVRRMKEGPALDWLHKQNLALISPLLQIEWILDIDNTVKPIYGNQEGAEIGYNPQKHGRPSHNYHSYFVANLRLCLGVEVLSGKRHAAKEGLPGLWKILDALPPAHWPSIIRGDCAYGNETILRQCELRALRYLFKLKITVNVRRLVEQSLRSGHHWVSAGEGWETLECKIKLHGWTLERRCILVREGPAKAPVEPQAKRRKNFHPETLAEGEGWDATPTPWSGKIAVLVTNLPLPPTEEKESEVPLLLSDHPEPATGPLLPSAPKTAEPPLPTPKVALLAPAAEELTPAAVAKEEVGYSGTACCTLYRGRGDAENNYDELKNQWGWGGFTTRSLSATRIMAMLVALVYNLWRFYVRFYEEDHNAEALTTRPTLMQGVGRQVASGGQKTIKFSILHGKVDELVAAITATSKEMSRLWAAAEQWTSASRWLLVLSRLFRKFLHGTSLAGLPPEGASILSG